MIFVNNFFSEIYFLQHSWVTHLIIFTKTFKKCFSWKYFSITKRITRKTVFLFPALALRNPTNNNVFQNSFLKKHYSKIFFLVFFLFIILCVHTHWWIIPNQSKFLKENKNQWQKYFLQTLILLLYHRSSVPSLKTLSFKNFFMENFFKNNYFSLS